ncbi:PREDICTED: uncharacterized protein LOC102803299 [Paramuricea clavata]|uniref:PREDICTED: uncharacterized protein LOC102803299 n=1 Tax=Paramuricea clavata TaxID=317549 RepID=A0A6S7L288_PARCT|nr:PREDICTED: uncharacterized protein LOC102803299 [Paramuricea clavata]
MRFVSRRGPPTKAFSDNGTNFKGAETEIKEALTKLNQDRISRSLRSCDIEWNFNPPAASHAGGVWERMIRSIRKILRSLMTDQLVNDETLATILAEVEKILNNRPFNRLSDDPNDVEPLTPNKLLLLRPNPCYQPVEFGETTLYNKKWKQAQYLASIFWKRWIKDYLPTLQERQKWLRPRRNVVPGDLVLVVQENVQRGQWPKAIVEEVFPDEYSHVRHVIIRTETARLRRDVRKLCLLESAI